MRRSWLAVLGVALALVTLLASRPARAEEYVIGAEDVLQVSVWMHPELERAVTVGADGSITFPPVGDLKAASQTPNQLATRLADRLSSYLRQTATVTVTVTQYLSQSVFVLGGVAKPGRYGFERLPGVVDVINQAGGASAGADLSQVQVIRREGDLRRPQTADVARALREGTDAGLPALKPGDTVVVPVPAATGGAVGGGAVGGDVVGVLGEVNRPGLYPVGGGQDVWMVLAAAGGITPHGHLGDVRVVRPKDSGTSVFGVNLKGQLARGAREPFVVHSGDVVFVTGSGSWGSTWTALTQFLAISRDLVNVVVLADYLKHKGGN
jgi:polysaccharide export outer membrane protein